MAEKLSNLKPCFHQAFNMAFLDIPHPMRSMHWLEMLLQQKNHQSHCSRCGSFCNHRNLHFQFHNQFLQEPSSLHQSGDNWTSCLPILPTILRKSNYPKVLISSFIGQKFQDILTNTKNHHLLGQRSTIFTLRVDATKFM